MHSLRQQDDWDNPDYDDQEQRKAWSSGLVYNARFNMLCCHATMSSMIPICALAPGGSRVAN